jgi:3-mercaptopyruvate sulfurtransferase SseA
MGTQELRKDLFATFAVIVLATALLAACTAATPQAEATPTSPAVAAPQEVQRITLEESKAAFDSNSAIFLDVRSETSYATSHIPGALSIPLAELEARIAELDPSQWIITYCT